MGEATTFEILKIPCECIILFESNFNGLCFHAKKKKASEKSKVHNQTRAKSNRLLRHYPIIKNNIKKAFHEEYNCIIDIESTNFHQIVITGSTLKILKELSFTLEFKAIPFNCHFKFQYLYKRREI